MAAAALFLPASIRKIFLLEKIWSVPLTWLKILIRTGRRPGDLSWGQCPRLGQRWGCFTQGSECSLCLSWLNSLKRVVPGSRASIAGGFVHPPDFRSRSCRKWGHSLSTWPVWATSQLTGCDIALFSNDAECKYLTASMSLSVPLIDLVIHWLGSTTAIRKVQPKATWAIHPAISQECKQPEGRQLFCAGYWCVPGPRLVPGKEQVLSMNEWMNELHTASQCCSQGLQRLLEPLSPLELCPTILCTDFWLTSLHCGFPHSASARGQPWDSPNCLAVKWVLHSWICF